jgi:hypothetical protein
MLNYYHYGYYYLDLSRTRQFAFQKKLCYSASGTPEPRKHRPSLHYLPEKRAVFDADEVSALLEKKTRGVGAPRAAMIPLVA